MKLIISVIIFFSYFIPIRCRSYENYTLYNLVPTERYQLKFLQNLEFMDYIHVFFWKRPYKLYSNIQVMVHPSDVGLFEERLKHFALNSTVLTHNIQTLLETQVLSKYARMRTNTYVWTSYHTLEDLYQWMSDINIKYSDNVDLKAIGKSAEGREILALEIISPKAKAKVIVEGAIHGDEWITTEFITYLANELLNANSSGNARLKQVASKFHWILIPVLNPDGYVYSMKVDRLWSKNRRVFGNGDVGVDLDKNFDYNFCSHGGSNKSGDMYYCGPTPFSEPETQALSQFVNESSERLNYYFSFHAYGQYIIIPYSDRIKHLENYSEMENYAKQAIMKMYKMNGVKYGYGTIYDVFGIRESGDSISWVKRTHNVKYAISFYLRDNGTYGYALPADQILPTCQETLVGLVELMTARHRHVGIDFNSASIMRPNIQLLFIILFLY